MRCAAVCFRRFCCMCLALSLKSAGTLSAAEYFVSTGGVETADGLSWATPVQSISNALAMAATDGDIVTVSNGTYKITAPIQITNGVTVRSLNGWRTTVVDGSLGTGNSGCFWLSNDNAIVDGFTITNGTAGNPWVSWGGAYVAGGATVSRGLVRNCRIVACSGFRAGGARVDVGALRNCLIDGNSGADSPGAGGVQINHAAARVENCTIVRNTCPGSGAGVRYDAAGGMTNCIVYGNIGWDRTARNLQSAAGKSIGYSCLPAGEYSGGTGNIFTDPDFVDFVGRDYRLHASSPCIGTGTNLAWMTGANDLDGVARISPAGGAADIGAFEFNADPLACAFTATPLSGTNLFPVTFTAVVSGTNQNGLYYQWDFGTNGSIDAQGAGLTLLTTNLPYGLYSVGLTVTNDAGEVAASVRANYIKVSEPTNYVARAGQAPAFPYVTWATASSNVQAAVDAVLDGGFVLVSNGTYLLTSAILVDRPVTVRSANGLAVTLINGNWSSGGGLGCILVRHTNAVIDGFTITNGYGTTSYGGYFGGRFPAGGATIYEGTVQNCVITKCYGYNGGGVRLDYGTLRNCLLHWNDGGDSGGGGGGAYFYGPGRIESCTIVNNTGAVKGGGIRMDSNGTVTNSIIYGNTSPSTTEKNMQGTSARSVSFSCFPAAESSAGIANVTNDPQLVNLAGNDYRLAANSPCRDVGTNQPWMTGAKDVGGVTARVMPTPGGRVDIGAREFDTDALTCSFAAAPLGDFGPFASVTFTSTVSGVNLAGLYYWWDFGTNGTVEVEGSSQGFFSTNLGYGVFSIGLTVSNSAGEVVSFTRGSYVEIAARTTYVARAGWNTHTYPYATWATAASNIQAAIDAGWNGTAVYVTNGTYSQGSQITIREPLTVKSINGAGVTTIDGGNAGYRGLELDDPSAIVDGFTITRCNGGGYGPAIHFVSGGRVLNCVVAANSGGPYHRIVWVEAGGYMRNCVIRDNVTHRFAGVGGPATLENCLVTRNSSNYGGDTTSSNEASAVTGVLAYNCIFVDNTNLLQAAVRVPDIELSTVHYSICPQTNTAWAATGVSNLTNRPLFVSVASNDFRYRFDSPGINAGTNLVWALAPGAVDLDGKPRIVRYRVDMGPYEFIPQEQGTVITIR